MLLSTPRSALTAAFKNPKIQFGGNIHEDYDGCAA
jgi:hypothetical protein